MPDDKEIVIEYAGSRIRVSMDNRGFFQCPICGRLFASEKDLISHIIAHAINLTESLKRTPERG